MRGGRDVLLVTLVGVAMVLAASGTGFTGFEPEPPSARIVIDARVIPARAAPARGDRHQTKTGSRLMHAPGGMTRRQSGSRPILIPTQFSAPWHKRFIAAAATPDSNDLRGFLATMARAARDGHSIGITGDDRDAVWQDDAAK